MERFYVGVLVRAHRCVAAKRLGVDHGCNERGSAQQRQDHAESAGRITNELGYAPQCEAKKQGDQ